MRDSFRVEYECTAIGNPIPLVQWVFDNGTRLDFFTPRIVIHEIDINGTGRHDFNCFAENRVGNQTRLISIFITGGMVSADDIDDTISQVGNQDSINGEQAIGLAQLIEGSISVNMNSTTDNMTNTSNADESLSSLYLQVTRIFDGSSAGQSGINELQNSSNTTSSTASTRITTTSTASVNSTSVNSTPSTQYISADGNLSNATTSLFTAGGSLVRVSQLRQSSANPINDTGILSQLMSNRPNLINVSVLAFIIISYITLLTLYRIN